MFQTEIIIFFQSFSSDFLTYFFRFFTEIGRSSYVIPLIFIIAFGIDFRKGFILIHIFIWNGVLTNALKEIFALPRPVNVDSNVLPLDKGLPNLTPFKSMGGRSFFSSLPKDVVSYFRTHRIDSFGFPSGHTSGAASFWGSIWILFRKKWVRVVSVVMMAFIPFSRIYLGRHFLADILGGLVVGFGILLIFYAFVFRNKRLTEYLFVEKQGLSLDFKNCMFLFYLFLTPFFLLFIPGVNSSLPPSFWGINLSFFLIRQRGLPKVGNDISSRVKSIFVLAIFYLILNTGVKRSMGFMFPSLPQGVEFIREALLVFLIIFLSVEVCLRLGFMRRQNYF